MKFQLHKAFFLLLILGNTFLFVGYFEFTHAKIKKQLKTYLKQGVNLNELIDFEFSEKELSNLTWIKKKEFKIGSNYYDIVWKKKLKSGKYLLSCVNDKQETILFQNLTEKVQFAMSDFPHEHPLKAIFSLVQQKYLPNQLDTDIQFFMFGTLSQKYYAIHHFHSSKHIPEDVKPPTVL